MKLGPFYGERERDTDRHSDRQTDSPLPLVKKKEAGLILWYMEDQMDGTDVEKECETQKLVFCLVNIIEIYGLERLNSLSYFI